MMAAVHLGPDYPENLRTTTNTDFEQAKTSLDISQNLILDHKSEIFGISTIEWNTTPWMRTTLRHDRAIKLSKAHIYSDSVLCLGMIHEHPQSIRHWKDKVVWFMDPREYRELNEIDGEPVEFEWNIFPGLHEIQSKMAENRIRSEEFKDRIIFTSMYNDIDWTQDGNLKILCFKLFGS